MNAAGDELTTPLGPAGGRLTRLRIPVASALPLTVERIARWSGSLERRGIVLVPVSGAFGAEGRP